ncbi:MAG: glycosyltransferase [Synergistes sp.]|nr:glycosyltransferase [Synergistes sp.]
MRVLHYVDENRLSWCESWIALLCRLAELGVQNRAVCREGGTLAKRLRESGVDTLEYTPLISSLPAFCRGFGRIVGETAPDVIHTRLSSAAAIGGLWGKHGRIPVVSTVDKHAKVKYYRNADLLLPCSDAVARHMAGQGFPQEKLQVVYNPIDISAFRRNEPMRRKMRDGNSAGEKTVVIAAGGRFDDGKGFERLIEAYSILRERSGPDADTALWLIGDGPHMAAMKEEVSRLGVSGSVVFAGYVENIKDWLCGADIFVSPSELPEGFSVMLLEAVASGLPAVATCIGGSPELVTDGVNGVLYEPGDAELLAEKLLSLLARREMLPVFSREAVKSASRFSLDTVAADTVEIYERLASLKGKAK